MVDPLTASAITGFIVAIISGTILALMKRKWEKTDKKDEKNDKEIEDAEKEKTEQEEAIQEIQKSIWRLNKTVLIMAKLIDDQTAKVHSELSASLEDIAEELLGDPDKKS